ncbi:Rz-like spanin [Caulobacter phage Lullwater]|uniref:I-spanin n=1 Tax=Caulobacter phage Lullwater TaxID=2024607 RepID=A0A291LC59_9CAUD|nr:Rz-like spanin [Caulobacter phage Lullwater]ATI16358.1 I-spanin [Caulobacter phage Lullwater]
MKKTLYGPLLALFVVLVAALGGGLWAWKASRDLSTARSEVSRLTAENLTLAKGREADDKAANTQAKGYKAAGEQAAKRQEKLEKAIEANPDWANQPIPSDVLDSLR